MGERGSGRCRGFFGEGFYSAVCDFRKLKKGSDLLSVPDVTGDIEGVKVTSGNPVSGFVGVEMSDFISSGACVSWTDGLNAYLESHSTFLFTLRSNTTAIVREEGRYAVVDSHSRGTDGLVHPDGTSVVLRFRCLEALRGYISRLADSLHAEGTQFELCSVSVRFIVRQVLSGESSGE